MDQNHHLRNDLVEAWKRITDHTCTIEDLTLVMNSLQGDEYLREFDEVSDRVWNENLPPLTKEKEKIYRKEAALLRAEYERLQRMQQPKTPQHVIGRRFRKIWYAAAAAILLCVFIPAAYYYLRPKTEQIAFHFVETVTEHGEIKTIVLPDNSKVTLNAGSHLKYPASFSATERSVELHGEALFDVTSDPARPFTVQTDNMNVRVVGTVFGVKEYADDLSTSVSVASGKVEVNCKGGKTVLERNRQAKMDKTTGHLDNLTIDADNCLSWTNGYLYFDKTPIREAVNMLNRYYPQIHIVLAEGDYTNCLISAGKHNNKRAEAVLASIVYSTKLKFHKEGNTYTIYK